jgi:SAM-dependent methyltransferase
VSVNDRLEREREFHDSRFATGDSARPSDRFYEITEASSAQFRQRVLELARGADVLEYGCGLGSSAFDVAPIARHVSGIDISPVAIEHSRETCEAAGLLNVDFRVANAEATGFADASFDLIVGSGILHHLNLDASYAELVRLLRPGGRAIFSEPLGHNPAINLYRKRTPQERTSDEHPLLMRDFDAAKKYFRNVDVSFFHLATLAAIPLRSTPPFAGVVRLGDAFDRLLFRVVPAARRYAWLCVVELAGPVGAG